MSYFRVFLALCLALPALLISLATPASAAPEVWIEPWPTQVSPTNGPTVSFLITFSEPVTGFGATDVSLSLSADATVTDAAPADGSAYRCDVSDILADGALCATIPAGAAIGIDSGLPNSASPGDACVVVDRTPPPPPDGRLPSDGAARQTVKPKFSWAAPDDATGIKNYRIVIQGPISRDTYVTKASYTPTLAEGVYTWRVNCRDGAGNVSDWSETWTLTLDATAPGPVEWMRVHPLPGEWTAHAEVDIEVVPAIDGLSGVAGHVVAWQPSATWNPSGEVTHSADWGGGSLIVPHDGLWWLYVWAIDRAGNVGPVIPVGPFGVDREPPSVIAGGICLPNDPGKPYATFRGADLGVVDRFDPSPTVTLSISSGTLLPLGKTIAEVIARDHAGNVFVGQLALIVTNTEPPAIAVYRPEDGERFALGEVVLPSWTVSSLAPILDVRVEGLVGSLLDTSAPGRRAFAVSATDATGLTASARVGYLVAYAARSVEFVRVRPNGNEDLLAALPEEAEHERPPTTLKANEWLRVRCMVDRCLEGMPRALVTYSLVRRDSARPDAPILERIGALADNGVAYSLDVPLAALPPGSYTLWIGFVDETSERLTFELVR